MPALAVVLGIAFCIATYIFYSSPLRDYVEDYFFDVRTRIKPVTDVAKRDVTVVSIDENTIDELDGSEASDLSYDSFLRVISALRSTAAREIVVLYFLNIFGYDHPQAKHVIKLVEDDPRITLGTLGLYSNSPSSQEFPTPLSPIRNRVYGADALKKRSNSVVRDLPFYGWQGRKQKPMLPYYVAKKAGYSVPSVAYHGQTIPTEIKGTTSHARYPLNFIPHEEITTVKAEDVLENPSAFSDKLEDRIVVLGYTVFREWTTQTREHMAANTPLKARVNTYEHGESITFITANAIENLIHARWLVEPSRAAQLVQVILVTALFGYVWKFGIIPATLTIFGGWTALLFIHGFFFAMMRTYIPLSDTALFSSMTLIAGALWRLNIDFQAQAESRAKTAGNRELMRVQSRFLDRFSNELAKINDSLRAKLANLHEPTEDTKPAATGRELLQRARASSTDFAEYLEGIKQLSEIEGGSIKKAHREPVRVADVLESVLARFDAKITQQKTTVERDWPPNIVAETNPRILDTIIFNLVSNALKYTPANSTVRVSAWEEGRSVHISVTDEGPGIAPEHQEKIFERFYRVKDDNVYKVKGTGLGLYLCRYFASRIDAEISCNSQPGQGSTFTLTVRRARNKTSRGRR